jgi:hypothetical protein
MNAEAISQDLKKTLRRLKLSRLLDTLPQSDRDNRWGAVRGF